MSGALIVPGGVDCECGILAQLSNQLNFDAGAKRDLGNTEGASRMLAEIAEDFAEKFGSAVGHEVLLGEGRGAVHQHHQLDDA
jgi:hypothetical protein